jgi:hypothetical protein
VDDEDTPDTAASHPDLDRHSALVKSSGGRLFVALLLTTLSFWIVAPNMPASAMRARLDALWAPANSIGLNQDWGVFSPNPRNQSLEVRARIEYVDGTSEFWDLPDFDPFIGAYRQYRWQKWQERVRLDETSSLWEPTARWIAERMIATGRLPERIVLIRRWIDHFPLTIDGAVDSGWNEFEFFTWDVQL